MKRSDVQKSLDMTSGSIVKHILRFAFPLLIGNIFQQMYNTVDSVIVGNYVGKEALAAVGSVGPIINMLIALFNGLGVGAGILISRFYGAHDKENVHKAVQTTLALTMGMSVVMTVVAVSAVPLLLQMMETPADVFDQSKIYLQIYFAGLAGLMTYNMSAAILRAVGDSRRPLYFLIFCALLNTVLDLLFVAVFSWGIAGAALATTFSQFCSAALVLFVLTREKSEYGIRWNALCVDWEITKQICRIGWPSAIQMAITSFSNVFVQSYINRLGSACMAGWTAYVKIDAFAVLPMMTFSQAATTFVGQNLGAQRPERVKRGVKVTVTMVLLVTAAILIPMMIFAEPLNELFCREEDVVFYGTLFIRLISPFYLLMAVFQCLTGVMKGYGATKACMFITVGSFVFFRQFYLYVVYRLWPDVIPTVMAYPAGWVVGFLILLVYYKKGRWRECLQQKHSA